MNAGSAQVKLRRERPLRVAGPAPIKRKRRSFALAWGLALTLMFLVATVSWIGSAYIFGHPEEPRHYAFLTRLGQVDPPREFTIFDVPQGQALGATEIYSKYRRFLLLSPGERRELNRRLLREYIKNYHRSGPVDYASGSFRVMEVRVLDEDSFMPGGLSLIARSVEIEDLEIEYFMPGVDAGPGVFRAGDELTIEGGTAYAAVIRLEPLGEGRLRLLLVPLVYGPHTSPEGGRLNLSPPPSLNPAALWQRD